MFKVIDYLGDVLNLGFKRNDFFVSELGIENRKIRTAIVENR